MHVIVAGDVTGTEIVLETVGCGAVWLADEPLLTWLGCVGLGVSPAKITGFADVRQVGVPTQVVWVVPAIVTLFVTESPVRVGVVVCPVDRKEVRSTA